MATARPANRRPRVALAAAYVLIALEALVAVLVTGLVVWAVRGEFIDGYDVYVMLAAALLLLGMVDLAAAHAIRPSVATGAAGMVLLGASVVLLLTFVVGPVDEPPFVLGLLAAVSLVGVALARSVRAVRRRLVLVVGSGFIVVGLLILATLALVGPDPQLVVASASLIAHRVALSSIFVFTVRAMGPARDGPPDGPTTEPQEQEA